MTGPSSPLWITWVRPGRAPRGLAIAPAMVRSTLSALVISLLCSVGAGALTHRWFGGGSTDSQRGTFAAKEAVKRGLYARAQRWSREPMALSWGRPEEDTSPACSGRTPVDRAPFNGEVALTFDDGPAVGTTARLLGVLKAHGAPATFFVNGKNLESADQQLLLRAIADEPLWDVANHGWSHDNLAGFGVDDVRADVERTSEALLALGVRPTFFRFPFGQANCEGLAAVRRLGLRVAGWHVSSADWCYGERDGWCRPWRYRYVPRAFQRDMVGFVMRQLKRTGGGVVLLHDGVPLTADVLPELLERIDAEGYRLVRLDDPKVFPRLNALGQIAER